MDLEMMQGAYMLRKTRAALGIGLFSLLTAVPVNAQDVVTLALRNGERPSGELVGMNANGVMLRFGGQDHPYSLGDIRTIEFIVDRMLEAEGKKDASTPFVITRAREVFDARLVGMEDRRPIRLNFQLPDGRMRQLSHAELGQVWVTPGPGPAAVPTSGAAPAALPRNSKQVAVAATEPWTDTGINVRRGLRIQVSATGDITLGPGMTAPAAGSAGATVERGRYPVRDAYAGALIGRIGNGAPFLIGGNTQPMDVRGTGRLYLGINDDVLADNSGNFNVVVSLVP
jgi:hypothetical protein